MGHDEDPSRLIILCVFSFVSKPDHSVKVLENGVDNQMLYVFIAVSI